MHEGRPAGEVSHEAMSEEAVMQLATGTASTVGMSKASRGFPHAMT